MQQIALDLGLVGVPTLDNFLAGPNAPALSHLQLAVASPLRSPVPTYLWGPTASGKTHLLRGVQQALAAQGMDFGVLDASVRDAPGFADNWQAVLMDDVHLYDAAQQHTAFNWFVNALNAPDGRSRWVLACGSLPPADLRLREDLRSRLGWGHVFQLQVLADPERRAVLRQAADARGVFLSDEVMDFMLHRFSRDLGSLMDLLEHLDRYALQTQRAVTVPLLKSMLENT